MLTKRFAETMCVKTFLHEDRAAYNSAGAPMKRCNKFGLAAGGGEKFDFWSQRCEDGGLGEQDISKSGPR